MANYDRSRDFVNTIFAVDPLHKTPNEGISYVGYYFMWCCTYASRTCFFIRIRETVLCVVPVLIAAFAYPLGNRKMMQVCKGN